MQKDQKHHVAQPGEIGEKALRSLGEMRIPPLPPYYEVWFYHLSGSNPQLTNEIKTRLAKSDSVDVSSLTKLYRKYFASDIVSNEILECTSGIARETTQVRNLVQKYDNSTRLFAHDLSSSRQALEGQTVSRELVKSLMESLVTATNDALKRNSELEADLSAATAKINSLQNQVDVIAKDANTDKLTQIYNRRFFDNEIEKLVTAAREFDEPLSLIMADIDYFKKFNDMWGHQVGDAVLRYVASVLKDNIKGQDLLARFGGEEFVIALPNTTLNGAVKLAEHIRCIVSAPRLINKLKNTQLGHITISIGASAFENDWSVFDLIQHADEALYEAKKKGRNQVFAANVDSLSRYQCPSQNRVDKKFMK